MSESHEYAKAVRAKVDIVDVIGLHISLKKKGPEHMGVCPFHQDDKASLSVNRTKQIYKCFACGAYGDVIDFLCNYSDMSFAEACKALDSGAVVTASGKMKFETVQKAKTHTWNQIKPDKPPGEIEHYLNGKPSRIWEYKYADGSTCGYTARFDFPDGEKMVLPYTYVSNGKYSEWRWLGFDAPRPLYNLHLLNQRPDKTVIVVEGEKTADALQNILSNIVVVSWIGGADGVSKTDFGPLEGRKVLLWPDNDYTHKYGDKHKLAGITKPLQEQPGNKAMIKIASLIKNPALLKYIENPPDTPCGWDIADGDASVWTPEYTLQYVRSNMRDEAPSTPDMSTNEAPPPEATAPDEKEVNESNFHFQFLGWSKSETGSQRFNFFTHGSKAVFSLNATGLGSEANLLTLAPKMFWEEQFPQKAAGFDISSAIGWIIHNTNKIGPFRTKAMRGRGAWIDAERIVLHDGSKLIVNGETTSLGKLKTKYVYEASEPLGFNADKPPLSSADASKLLEILGWLNWEREINSYLLAGWCVIAPFCGVLLWRPHIWLTGAAGTGKSWLFKMIVRMLLGETALAVQGETTEAGLRQLLGHDALPVLFDEAESEDRRSNDRVQSVLGLMRISSADDGGILAKGTAGGLGSRTYRIRSCFAFASIGLQVAQQSDRTRVTILSLKNLPKEDPVRQDRWKNLVNLYNDTINKEYAERLQARTIKLLPVITENIRTFSNAVAAELGEQRVGDQLGALLAGAYSLKRTDKISYEDAIRWIREKNWDEEKSLDQTKDEYNLLSCVIEHNVTVETITAKYERSIGELIQIASVRKRDDLILPELANDKLKRCGIKIDDTMLYIHVSNSHKYLLNMLQNTAWAKNHNKILRRIEGSKDVVSARFSGNPTRAVAIPVSLLFPDDNNE